MSPLIPAMDSASLQFHRFRTHGDPKALGAVFDATAPDLMALASHFTSDMASAEDLVQECFLVAMKKAKSWDSSRPVVPWLAGILIAEARKRRRRRGRWLDPERLAGRAAPEGLAEALHGELRSAVELAVEQLPARYREVVQASLLSGEEPQAIARRLHRAPGTVRVQLHRGLDLLRRALPAGIGLGLLGALSSRGLDEVRRHLIAEASVLGPTLAAASTTSLTLTHVGTFIMGAKGLATATLLAVGLGIGLTQWGGAELEESVLKGAVAPAAEERPPAESLVALSGERERQELEVPGGIDAEVAPVGLEQKPTETSDLRGRVWLAGEILAMQPPPSESFELEISAGAALDRKRTETLHGPGPFRVEITDLVGDDDPRELRILSVTRCEGYIPSSAWCALAKDSGEDEIVYQASMSPRAILRRITGRLVTPDGEAVGAHAQQPWVAFLPEDLEEPLEYQYLPWAAVEPDGTFELNLTDQRPGAVLYTANGFAAGRRNTTTEFAAGVELLECGDLVLPRGATIEGQAFVAGGPAPVGSVVIATTPYRASPWDLLRRRLRLRDGRALHAGVEAAISKDGRFVLEGLEAGVSYGLTVVPKASGTRVWPALEEGAGKTVTAPTSGVELHGDLVELTLRVLANQAPAPGVRIRSRAHEDGDARWVMPHKLLGGLSAGFEVPGRNEMKLWIAPDRVTELFVAAKGFDDQPLDLDPSQLEPGETVTVELTGDVPTAELRVRLEGRSLGSMETWSALLITYNSSMRPEFIGPVPIEDGMARFEMVAVDVTSVRLALDFPSTLTLSELPLFQSAGIPLQVAGLEKDEVREVVARLPLCGRIELHLVGRDDAAVPAFELVEANGNVVRPPLLVASEAGHSQVYAVEGDGPMLLGSTLPPGTYVLRQAAPGYEAGEREVEVTAGEVTLVSFQLDSVR